MKEYVDRAIVVLERRDLGFLPYVLRKTNRRQTKEGRIFHPTRVWVERENEAECGGRSFPTGPVKCFPLQGG